MRSPRNRTKSATSQGTRPCASSSACARPMPSISSGARPTAEPTSRPNASAKSPCAPFSSAAAKPSSSPNCAHCSFSAATPRLRDSAVDDAGIGIARGEQLHRPVLRCHAQRTCCNVSTDFHGLKEGLVKYDSHVPLRSYVTANLSNLVAIRRSRVSPAGDRRNACTLVTLRTVASIFTGFEKCGTAAKGEHAHGRGARDGAHALGGGDGLAPVAVRDGARAHADARVRDEAQRLVVRQVSAHAPRVLLAEARAPAALRSVEPR
eukprot:6211400-Pleurochrysis_carterae.AAC.1